MGKAAVLQVLDRAAHDLRFVVQMTYDSSRALEAYDLSQQERAALVSGDIPWLEAHVGRLNGLMSTWTRPAVQQANRSAG
jgi:hypothetical protein